MNELILSAQNLAATLEVLQITNEAEKAYCAEYWSKGRAKIKEIEAAYKALIDPIKAEAKTLEKERDSGLSRLELAVTNLNKAITKYDQEQKAKAAEERRKAEEEKKKLENFLGESVEVAKPVSPEPAKIPGAGYRTYIKHRIIDASLIPREWLMPDDKRIGEYGRTFKMEARIPGVEFFEDTKLV